MILYTDIDPFCCEVLRARVTDGGLLPGEVWERDITTLTAEELSRFTQVHLFAGIGGIPLGFQWAGWPADWSIVTGGFPCQDVSVAGKGLGVEKGARSGLWKEMHRVIDIVRPTWVLAENVPALRTRGADRVLGDLEQLGYAAWPLVVGAEHVGAPHRRHRVWIVAHAQGVGGHAGTGRGACIRGERVPPATAPLRPERDAGTHHGVREQRNVRYEARNGDHGGGEVAYRDGGAVEQPKRAGLRDGGQPGTPGPDAAGQLEHALGAGREERQPAAVAGHPRLRGWPAGPGPHQHPWEAPRLIEPGVGGATDGLPRRVAACLRRSGLKALGNAVVPQVVEVVARGMMEFSTHTGAAK